MGRSKECQNNIYSFVGSKLILSCKLELYGIVVWDKMRRVDYFWGEGRSSKRTDKALPI